MNKLTDEQVKQASSISYDAKGNVTSVRPMTKPRQIQRRVLRDETPATDATPADAPTEKPRPARTVIDDVRDAIGLLDRNDKNAWTKERKPRVEAIEAVLGTPVTDDQRDAAWALINEAKE